MKMDKFLKRFDFGPQKKINILYKRNSPASSEQTPFALISSVGNNVVFQQEPPSKEEVQSVLISLEDDLYAPLIKTANWKENKKTSKRKRVASIRININ